MRTVLTWVCLAVFCPLPLPGRALAYPLDALSRVLEANQPMPCELGAAELVTYTGQELRYQKPLQVHPAFRAQLAAFEQMVKDLAVSHYGRAPRKIVHLGGYNCRRMRRYPTWVSEHALGNAVDVAGFDFGPLPKGATLPEGMPSTFKRAFQVRMKKHWTARGASAWHATFLRTLAERIIARPDVFHVILGPAWPGHKNHLHLDHAPYRVVEVFGEGQ